MARGKRKIAAGAERERLTHMNAGSQKWHRWGPYLSERQWGVVREDYSGGGDAWNHFPHDMAVYRAYRWGEDGICGISDNRQRLCFAIAMWNGHDPILKERLFGLANEEANHGEDVKELYWYLDATPTHSYLSALYKYPHREYPYAWLREESRRRNRNDPEFELLDTGIFAEERYFDVFCEYAKEAPDDILIRITVTNCGNEKATLHFLPQLWFRNSWSWTHTEFENKPRLTAVGANAIKAFHPKMGEFRYDIEGSSELIFCENETNPMRFGAPHRAGYWKDGFHEYVVRGNREAVNPAREGTKSATLFRLDLDAKEKKVLRFRLSRHPEEKPFDGFDRIVNTRLAEANAFYDECASGVSGEDGKRVHRQALAGMIWTKQVYRFDVAGWRRGDAPAQPSPPWERQQVRRNADWEHLDAGEILSMPDKWEYPWFAAWDSAFHCLPLSIVDPEFAKRQLVTLTREWYLHPNGQIPAYEWDFGDVNPPVHAYAAWRIFVEDRERYGQGQGDYAFLERVFHKLMLNFTWWVNRKDAQGRNVFQGGFLGLDNIGVFERNKPLPGGGQIDQADGTAWMAMYSLDMMRIALELAADKNIVYEDIASKFLEHFLRIAYAMFGTAKVAGGGLWDDEDGFYYDTLRMPDGRAVPMKVRSVVGLVPLFAVEVLEPETLKRAPGFTERLEWVMRNHPDLASLVSRWEQPGAGERRLLSLLRGSRMKKLLRRVLDEDEFLSPYGIRSLSKFHEKNPYVLDVEGTEGRVTYDPAESRSNQFGGNSNWRGPIWLPINYLIIYALRRFHRYYGDDFKVECPTGSGNFVTLAGAATEIARRLSRLFLRDGEGRRAIFGQDAMLQNDPNFKDFLFFHEYFDGDNGRGLGALHQTGWTGLIANIIETVPPTQR